MKCAVSTRGQSVMRLLANEVLIITMPSSLLCTVPAVPNVALATCMRCAFVHVCVFS